ncbi:MAG: pentapeptide repeat-containing protein [Proteobacteria bacterium]|nr:pentapeptide repeat-containing protein [Pseudomonadota bacterium]
MREEIDRVLQMVKDGTLTPQQATEMIGALREAVGEAEPASTSGAEPAPDAAPESERSRHGSRHRRHRWRHGRGGDFERVFDHLGDDIEKAMGAGARSAVFSRADAPTGQDFVCEDNELAVSHLRDLRLNRSTFSHNELNAASMQDMELNDSRATGQRLRGSSIKGALIENGELLDNEFNGVGIVNLTVSRGRLTGSHFNGAQVRDFGISASSVEGSRLNGTKLKTIVIRSDSVVKGLDLNGVLGRNWLCEDAVISETQFIGVRVDGLVLKHSGLERVVFKTTNWTERLENHSLGLMRDLELQRVILKDCRFEDCRFDGTHFEGFDASDLTFRGVDFTGRVIKTADEFARLAQARNVA